MKKTFLLTLLLAGLFQMDAQNNIVKASVVFGNAGVQYERALGKHFSVAGQGGFAFVNISDRYGNNEFTTGVGYSAEARVYFSSRKGKMQGWHIGPAISFMDTKSDLPEKFKSTIYSVMTGSQWKFKSNLTLEFVLGVGHKESQYDGRTIDGDDSLPVFVTGGVSVGYAF
ncbi:MAG TPA: DUF3575 domain-containing protein [Flavobacterium sp.]|jgi:hypothetical protein|nr:DUF3575 domain-containing protein [Flavobacterium sp.]HPJ10450.1 DUF3575 domain-containing protein [Flavobacterium sp.]